MTSESKILTVSYGTFSCTLEGFDDPFNTMKAIAEYFRDLAAEDRYFGAEPPQPDAAMLHRIAEREVTRLVDTRGRDALGRDLGGAEKRAIFQPRGAAAVAAGVNGVAEAKVKPVEEPAAQEPSLQDVIPDGVAAKLARIRQSVNPPLVTAPLPDEVLRSFEVEDDLPAPIVDHTTEEFEDSAFQTSSDVLDRLGALMQAPAEAAADDVKEPELNSSSIPALSNVPEDATQDQSLDNSADLEEAGFLDHDAMAEPLDEADAAAISAPAWEADAASVLKAAEPFPEAFVEGSDVFADTGLSAEADRSEPALPEPVLADLLPEDEAAAPTSLTEALSEDPVPETMDAAEAQATPEPDAEPTAAKGNGRSKRVNSRIVRLHPDAEDGHDQNAPRALTDPQEDAEVARLLRQADDVMAGDDTRRRQDSIAHLKAAVVATEADRAATGEARPTSKPLDPYREDLAQAVQPDPEPEVRPRRKTVSVRPQEPRPGTIRPGMISPPPLVLVSEQRIDRVPLPPAPPAPMPREGQPMVALRTGRLTGAIGIGAAAASPVLPHQKLVLEKPAQSTSADIEEDDDIDEDLTELDEAGLASFAERVGVKSMAEMLEAAAAYATCIENRSQFTRPQLMRRLMASAGGRPVSREDGLRSFGTLLRTGRIEKVSRGHYALADSSPYLAEARRYS